MCMSRSCLQRAEGSKKGLSYHEIGRSIATMMADDVFHNVAYKAVSRRDLLAGIDEFLDSVTVLPPGEWDPSIRIEPPANVPSQESRTKRSSADDPDVPRVSEEVIAAQEREKAGLIRSGRLFGGLINDVKRKLPK